MTKEFLKAAGIRAARTAAQAAVGVIGSSALINEVDWKVCASTIALSTLLSFLNSIITGLPEA